jgi:hypothetical protein
MSFTQDRGVVPTALPALQHMLLKETLKCRTPRRRARTTSIQVLLELMCRLVLHPELFLEFAKVGFDLAWNTLEMAACFPR